MSPGDYAAVANARAKEVGQRLAFAAFIALATAVFTGSVLVPAGWFVLMVIIQVMDGVVSRPIRRHPDREPSVAMKTAYALSMALNATLFSSIAVFMWFGGDVAGKAFAVLMPAGAVLAMSVRIGSARRVLIAGWAPHAAYLVGIPVAAGILSPQPDLFELGFLSLGGVLFLAHVLVAVVRIERGARALQVAHATAEQSRIEAERANATKSDFLATITHEIRTPLNAVIAAAGLLRRTELKADQAEHVQMLSNASEVLMGLLNDVLDLAKIESGKIVLEAAEFDLVEKLSLGVQLWRPRAAERGVELVFDRSGLPERIVTDPLRLQQIVFNLLSNAVKFTDRGRIELRGGCAGGRVWLEVEDTGCGMDAETAERVFESFEQASAGTARQHGGTGLGLSISRRLAELLGGSLTVRSELGRGSVFRLEFAMVDAAAPAAPDADAPAAPTCEGLRVLVADDHPVNQRIVRLILEPLGCRVTAVNDGGEAVLTATDRAFDVILMDMQMPVMGGVEATCLIREGGANADTPIVALTANAMDEHRAQWAAAGVHLFASKPVIMEDLIQVIVKAADLAQNRSFAQPEPASNLG